MKYPNFGGHFEAYNRKLIEHFQRFLNLYFYCFIGVSHVGNYPEIYIFEQTWSHPNAHPIVLFNYNHLSLLSACYWTSICNPAWIPSVCVNCALKNLVLNATPSRI